MTSNIAQIVLNTYHDVDLDPLQLKMSLQSDKIGENPLYKYFFESKLKSDDIPIHTHIEKKLIYIRESYRKIILKFKII